MNKIVFALVITAMTTSTSTANARDNDPFAFLQCGVKLGGKYLAYNASPDTKSFKDTRMNHVAGMIKAEPRGGFMTETSAASSTADPTDPSNTLEFRLPPKITLAGVGCSWL
jgi:hypothetical protein